MSNLFEIEPISLWTNFYEICKIPRPSKKEELIRNFLISFSRGFPNLNFSVDDIGNLLIRKPAFSGCENSQTIILQAHLDMVCEKNDSYIFDFEKDTIIPVIDNGWIHAEGTTLGADNGIGIAAMMTILSNNNLVHGPIECLFTVDEESGMTGAMHIKPDFLSGRILLNLDSEDDGEIFIGCAGGIDTIGELFVDFEKVSLQYFPIRICVSGLLGGHSGDDINKGRANSIKILSRFLTLASDFDFKISDFHGGNLKNAIAREAVVLLAIHKTQKERFIGFLNQFISDIEHEYELIEPNLKIDFSSIAMFQYVMTIDSQLKFLNILNGCPHGVLEMSPRISGMVETSTNLASVKMSSDKIIISTSQRSELESRKLFASKMVSSIFILAGCKVTYSDGYPGWSSNPASYISNIVSESYERLFGEKPLAKTVHAGLECGLFLEKYPNMDMVSFGPTIKNAHSPDEKVLITSVEKFWIHLVDILKALTLKY